MATYLRWARFRRKRAAAGADRNGKDAQLRRAHPAFAGIGRLPAGRKHSGAPYEEGRGRDESAGGEGHGRNPPGGAGNVPFVLRDILKEVDPNRLALEGVDHWILLRRNLGRPRSWRNTGDLQSQGSF